MTALQCPGCAHAMREVVHDGLAFDRCECGRLWFDRHELDEYARRHEPAQRRLEGRSRQARSGPQLRCPRCAELTLRPMVLGDVQVHACARCNGNLLVGESALRPSPPQSGALAAVMDAVTELLTWLPWV